MILKCGLYNGLSRFLIVLFLLTAPLALTSCSTAGEHKAGPELYARYDARVEELRRAVDRGEITVSEAEELRKEAFEDYLKEIEKMQVEMEYRNY